MASVSIRTLKRNLGIGRAATFRHFLNCFEINGGKYGEFVADTNVPEDLANFLCYNQFFIKEFEKDYYTHKTPAEIASKINRKEKEIIAYLEKRNYKNLSGNQPLKYVSTYRIDWKLGGNYSFLNLLLKVSRNN